jgi:hypothetical protein
MCRRGQARPSRHAVKTIRPHRLRARNDSRGRAPH